MISFQPTEEESAFVEVAKSFGLEHLRPKARLIEEAGKVPQEICRKLLELGMTTLELSESFGGLELPLVSQVQILEALTNGDLAAVQGLPGINEVASFIRQEPENPLFVSFKKEYLSGNWPTVSLLIHQGNPKLTIDKNGKGYRLNGTSIPVKMGLAASCLLIAGEDENGEAIILWLENSGETRWDKVPGEYRLGLLASQCARLHFHQLNVSEERVIVRGETASQLMRDSLARIHVLEAAKEVGTMTAALTYATEYTAQRKAFGKEIAKFQGVSFTVAQMALQTQAARNLVWHAAKKLDNQEPDAIQLALSALSFAHRAIRFVTDSAVQLLGGHGYVQEHPVEKWMRDAQAQVNLFEPEGDLLARSGEYLLIGKERRSRQDDLLRNVGTAKSS